MLAGVFGSVAPSTLILGKDSNGGSLGALLGTLASPPDCRLPGCSTGGDGADCRRISGPRLDDAARSPSLIGDTGDSYAGALPHSSRSYLGGSEPAGAGMEDSPTSSDPVLASGVNLGAVGEESEVPVPAGSLPSELLGS
jgi:hypothetical protein